MILEARQLVKVYGGHKGSNSTYALNGVDVKVGEGEFLGVMGPSGSGKTTLLNLIGSIDKATSGSIKINGKKIEEFNKDSIALFRRRNIGFIFQDFNLMDSLTIQENIMLPLILDKKESKVMEGKAKEVMDFLDIYDIKDKFPYNVSGGQQQRTAAARALITEPAIMLADEPTGNLDSKSSKNIMECFRKINEEKNSTILMVTHDPFAASYCSRIVFLKDGKVNMEITKKGSNKSFFNRILDCLAVIEGSV